MGGLALSHRRGTKPPPPPGQTRPIDTPRPVLCPHIHLVSAGRERMEQPELHGLRLTMLLAGPPEKRDVAEQVGLLLGCAHALGAAGASGGRGAGLGRRGSRVGACPAWGSRLFCLGSRLFNRMHRWWGLLLAGGAAGGVRAAVRGTHQICTKPGGAWLRGRAAACGACMQQLLRVRHGGLVNDAAVAWVRRGGGEGQKGHPLAAPGRRPSAPPRARSAGPCRAVDPPGRARSWTDGRELGQVLSLADDRAVTAAGCPGQLPPQEAGTSSRT